MCEDFFELEFVLRVRVRVSDLKDKDEIVTCGCEAPGAVVASIVG